MSVRDSNTDEPQTIIENLNQNDHILDAMLSMPTRMNEQMVESRREEVFSVLWEELDMSQKEVLENVRRQENNFIEKYGDVSGSLPTWLLRMEAQDVLMRAMSTRLNSDSVETETE